MAVTTPPPPAPGPVVAYGPPGPPPAPEPPRASWMAQAATLVTVACSLAAFVSVTDGDADATTWAVTTLLALVVGTAVATLTPVGRVFRRVSAFVAGFATAIIVLIVVLGLAYVGVSVPPLLAWAIIAAVCGLDLCFAPRLRTLVFLSGLAIVLVLGGLDSFAIKAAIGWFVTAMVALWLLTMDEARALDRPAPLSGMAPEPARRPDDLARLLGITLVIGITLAFLLSAPSCSIQPFGNLFRKLPWTPKINFEPGPGQAGRDYELDQRGNESRYYLDGEGRRFAQDPQTGNRYAVLERNGRTEIVDRHGEVVATIDGDTLTAHGPDGERVPYRRDGTGWHVEAPDGSDYTVGANDDGPILFNDDDSGPVSRSDRTPNGTTRLTPGAGDSLLPYDRNGDGLIPVPNGAILDSTTGVGSEQTFRVDRNGDGTTVRDLSGETRQYRDRRGTGPEVDIRDSNGEHYRYEFNENRDKVTVYDQSGDKIGESKIDREGNTFDGDRSGGGSNNPDDTDGKDGKPKDPPKTPDVPVRTILYVLGGIGAVVAAVLFYRWWRKRTPPDPDGIEDRTWAVEQVRRLEALGRDHGRVRARDESVVRFVAAVDREIAHDDRLTEVADVLDDALFGRRPLSVETRLRVEAHIDAVIEANPKLTRAERRDRDNDRFGEGGTGGGTDQPTPTPV